MITEEQLKKIEKDIQISSEYVDASFATEALSLIAEIRRLREALGDVVTLMSGAPSIAPLTDDLVLMRARQALGIEK